MAGRTEVKVEGLRQLNRQLAGLADVTERRGLYQRAGQVVVPTARAHAPKRTGELAGAIKSLARQREAIVQVGTKRKTPHAGAIHYGWPNRHHEDLPIRGGPIKAQPFVTEAVDRDFQRILLVFDNGVQAIISERGLE